MIAINWISVLFAAISATIFSYLWFEKISFGKILNQTKTSAAIESPFYIRYGTVLIMQIVIAFFMNLLIARGEYSGMADGIKFGFLIAFGFFGTFTAIIYWLTGRSRNIWTSMLVYVAISAMISGAILASMP
jgi:Protein of unknown function (DUF1761)